MKRRKKSDAAQTEVPAAEPAPDEPADGPQAAADQQGPEGYDRSSGPFDSAEVEDTVGYTDFGALLVPGVEGLTLKLEEDQGSRQLVAMTLVLDAGAVQVRALAAPRSGGLSQTHREGIVQTVAGSGGRSTTAEGPFGSEVYALVPIPQGQPGGPGWQNMRFAWIDGPRWTLTCAFFGQGADPTTWEPLNELVRRLVVERGREAMPVGSMLTLRPPEQPGSAASPAAGGPSLESLEPTDRITEVR